MDSVFPDVNGSTCRFGDLSVHLRESNCSTDMIYHQFNILPLESQAFYELMDAAG